MSIEKLRELSQGLEQREQAFWQAGDFASPGDQRMYYLGYGGEVVMPDGAIYEAYAKGWKDVALQVTFLADHPSCPGAKEELGQFKMIALDQGVSLTGSTMETSEGHDTQRASHLKIAELAQPFGSWIVDGLVQESDRLAHNKEIDEERQAKWKTLQAQVMVDKFHDQSEEDVLKSSGDILHSIVKDAGRYRPDLVTRYPRVSDIDPLRVFIEQAGNTAAGYEWATFNNEPRLHLSIVTRR